MSVRNVRSLTMFLVCVVGASVWALADGGAFQPDNVVRVDTLRVVETVEVPLRVDTVYETSRTDPGQCRELDVLGETILVSHVDVHGLRWERVEDVDHVGIQHVQQYRLCNSGVVVDLRPEHGSAGAEGILW